MTDYPSQGPEKPIEAVPLSQPLVIGLPSPYTAGGSPVPAGGVLGAVLSGSDAEAELVKGLLDHQLIIGAQATLAAAFLHAYGLGDMVRIILELRKYHQRPSGLVKALDAVSLPRADFPF